MKEKSLTTDEIFTNLILNINNEITNLKMNLAEDYINSVMMGDEVRLRELEETKKQIESVQNWRKNRK